MSDGSGGGRTFHSTDLVTEGDEGRIVLLIAGNITGSGSSLDRSPTTTFMTPPDEAQKLEGRASATRNHPDTHMCSNVNGLFLHDQLLG